MRQKTKILFKFASIVIFLILVGCVNSPFSAIQNIRHDDNYGKDFEGSEITIMTFNIRAGGGTENLDLSPKYVKATKDKLENLVAAIKSIDPDVVGLQEVRGYNQAKYFAEKLNMNFVYGAHGASNWWGLTILSKFKINAAKVKLINYGFL